MNNDMKNHVIQLLKASSQRTQRISLLCYELLQHVDISDDKVIDCMMTFGADRDIGYGPHRSHDKSFCITLNWQKFADAFNNQAVNAILMELGNLEEEQDRLCYYISLLSSREAQVIRRVYFDGCSWDQAAKELCVVRRTAHKIKERALENLTWMYEYIDGIEGGGASTAL